MDSMVSMIDEKTLPVAGASRAHATQAQRQQRMTMATITMRAMIPVSYTHLTLPTIYPVEISGVAVSIK